MTPLGLVEHGAPALPVLPDTTPAIQLSLEDTLASAGRLWVRGRLVGAFPPLPAAVQSEWWWNRWGRKPVPPLPAPTFRLEVRVSGAVLEATLPLQPGGRFEAVLPASLPRARRGWRVARYRAQYHDRAAEACGLILAPWSEVRSGVVVVLPLDHTTAPDAGQRLGRSQAAAQLTPVLQHLHRDRSGNWPLYYLAAVPAGDVVRASELALAATTLGWPTGNFILLPSEDGAAADVLLRGLDRLRELFTGELELVVLNREPALEWSLPAQLGSAEDRATVPRLVNVRDDAWSAVEGDRPVPVRNHSPSVRILRAGPVPRHPVVFCHGMLAYSMLRMQIPEDHNCFTPLRKFLQERGCRVFFPRVLPTGSVAERAAQLRDQIRAWTDEPVNLIAHSMGGLDCRFLISRLGLADRVRSLTTVASPHRGSYLADWFLANYRNRVPLLLMLEAAGVNLAGFRDCRPSACAEFNAQTPDAPGVRYFSYLGDVPQWKVTPVLRRAWTLLTAAEGPNDAMVSIASARWGEVLGTVSADHFAQTPDGLFVREAEDFDSLGFFTRIVEDLARRGF
jgi:triacylglycerol lipase